MSEKNKNRDILVLGATLFSMFFGAGNLIFPPELGFIGGTKWWIAFIGFFITGTGLPLLGIIASANSDGSMNNLAKKVSPVFSKILGVMIILSIGPLMAIPRTGATSFEMAILPVWPSFSPIIFSIIYFGISYLMAMNPTEIVDKIGKILTPTLVVVLLLIIIFGALNPMGPSEVTGVENPFLDGFQGGYQTMDAFAALLFGGVIINAVKERGYDEKKTQIEMTLKAGVLATIALTVIYGGLTYLGSRATGVLDPNITKVNLIMEITQNSLKSYGKVALSIVVTLACLTTTIGLITTVGQYFEELSKGKLSYKSVALATTVFSAIISVIGVDKIVTFSYPILFLMYPVVITLILLSVLFGNKVSDDVYKYSVILVLLTSILSTIDEFFKVELVSTVLSYLPFYKVGLMWIAPGIIGGLFGYFVSKSRR